MLAALSDADRSMITEMSAQGLKPTHIDAELGLNKGGGWVAEVIDALDLGVKKPGQSRRAKPKKQPPRPRASDLPRLWRERKRAKRREL